MNSIDGSISRGYEYVWWFSCGILIKSCTIFVENNMKLFSMLYLRIILSKLMKMIISTYYLILSATIYYTWFSNHVTFGNGWAGYVCIHIRFDTWLHE